MGIRTGLLSILAVAFGSTNPRDKDEISKRITALQNGADPKAADLRYTPLEGSDLFSVNKSSLIDALNLRLAAECPESYEVNDQQYDRIKAALVNFDFTQLHLPSDVQNTPLQG